MAPTKPRPSARSKVPPIHKLRVQDSFDRLVLGNTTLFSLSPPSLSSSDEKAKRKLPEFGDEKKTSNSPVAGPSSSVSHGTVYEKSNHGISRTKHISRRTKPKRVPHGLFSSFLFCSPAKGLKKRKTYTKKKAPQSKLMKEYTKQINSLVSRNATGPQDLPLFCSTPIAAKSSRRLSRSGLLSSDYGEGGGVDLPVDVSSIAGNRTRDRKEMEHTGDLGESIKRFERDLSRKEQEADYPVVGEKSLDRLTLGDPFDVQNQNKCSVVGSGTPKCSKTKQVEDSSVNVSSFVNNKSVVNEKEMRFSVGFEMSSVSVLLESSQKVENAVNDYSWRTGVGDSCQEPSLPVVQSLVFESGTSAIDFTSEIKRDFSTNVSPISDNVAADDGKEKNCSVDLLVNSQKVNETRDSLGQSNVRLSANSAVSAEETQSSNEASDSSALNFVCRTQRRLRFTGKENNSIKGDTSQADQVVTRSIDTPLGSSVNDSLSKRFELVSIDETVYRSVEGQYQSSDMDELEISDNALETASSGQLNESEMKFVGDEESIPVVEQQENQPSGEEEEVGGDEEAYFIERTRGNDLTTDQNNSALYDISLHQQSSSRSVISSPRTRISTRSSSRAKEENALGKLSRRPSSEGVSELNVLVEEDPTEDSGPFTVSDEENTPVVDHPTSQSSEDSDEEGEEEVTGDIEAVDVSRHSSDMFFERDQMSLSHLGNDDVCRIIGTVSGSTVGMRSLTISATSSRSNSLTYQNVSIEEEASSSAKGSGTSSPVGENDSDEISMDASELEQPASGSSHSKLSRCNISSPVSYSSGDSEKSSSSPEASHSEDEASFIQQTRYRNDLTTVRYNSALYDIPENQEHSSRSNSTSPRRTRLSTRRSNRAKEEKAPGKLLSSRPSTVGVPDLNVLVEEDPTSEPDSRPSMKSEHDAQDPYFPLCAEHLVLCPGKKYRKSLAIIRLLADEETCYEGNDVTVAMPDRGRHFGQSVEEVLRLQSFGQFEESRLSPVSVMRRRLSVRRSSLMKQCTPPPRRRAKHSIYSTPTGTMSLSFLSRPSMSSCQSFVASNDQTLRDETILAPNESFQQPSFKDIVFMACEQTEPCSFTDIVDETSFDGVKKVGEGVYGEVFFVNRGSRKNVFKIIPIEGDMIVNGERQKRYDEIYTELIITRELHCLTENEQYMCSGFAELVAPSIVRGRYPPQFIEMWLDYDETRGSDNDNPRKFGDNQLYLVLELGNGGTALEDYSFSTARQTLSIFKQVVMSLAVAERRLEFEHRDLHWGNILVSRITERYVRYVVDGKEYSLPTSCVKATIIDYTLSRMTHSRNNPIYNDIGKDPDMFIATGDYQFDIYRHMKKDVGNEWSRFVPKTNVRWLHYVMDKMINTVKYQRRSAKIHGDSMNELNSINSWLLACDSSYDVALRLFN